MTKSVPRILVVDDTAANLKLLQAIFEFEQFSVTLADSGEAALAQAARSMPDIVVLDLRMPGMDGIETLSRLKTMAPGLPVIILTSYLEVAAAVEAIKLGAEDFLIRPIQSDHLVLTVRRAMERHELKSEVENLRHLVDHRSYLARLITPNPRMRELAESIRAVASSNFTVLIQGETGTGKELVARAIHQESPRANNPFIAIDAGAIPEALVESELFGHEKGAFSGADRRKDGYFQTAHGGTLFLDEVSNLPLSSQPKLLRAIQERQVRPVGASRTAAVDVRIIAATNEALDERIGKGLFREDLYYRLAEFVIPLPPLRERREDILPLAQAFLGEATIELKRPASVITEDAAKLLVDCPWPGNVRQLRNVMRRAALQSSGIAIEAADIAIEAADLVPMLWENDGGAQQHGAIAAPPISCPRPITASATGSLRDIARMAVEQAEKQAIVAALRACSRPITKPCSLNSSATGWAACADRPNEAAVQTNSARISRAQHWKQESSRQISQMPSLAASCACTSDSICAWPGRGFCNG